MAETRGNKRSYITISSSSCEEEEQSESESESEEYDGIDDDDLDEMSASTSCDDDEEEGRDDEGDESDEENDGKYADIKDEESADIEDEESRLNSVIRLLRGRGDLHELNLKDCRAYLRKHGLRITGTKVECIQRIMEHWRLKDGNAEAFYPRSSFTINCTGDVCKGDAVLFVQKVYKKFDKMVRSGTLIGKRTVAGRVVKESYGAAKQQHTFTIEVLWSKGINKLLPLSPLLVKGRNLYKLRTFRQRWKNEKDRQKVLAEKHKRGAAARLVRAKTKSKNTYTKNGGTGVKRQKHSHPTGKKAEEKGKHVNRRGKAQMVHAKSGNHRQKARPVARPIRENSNSSAPKSSRNHQNFSHPKQYGDVTARTHTFPPHFHQSQILHQWNAPFQFPPTGTLSPRMSFPHFRPSQNQGSNHGFYSHQAYSYPGRLFDPRN